MAIGISTDRQLKNLRLKPLDFVDFFMLLCTYRGVL